MQSLPPPAPPPPQPNTQFDRFTLIDRIAVGGMAEVFRASEPRGAGEPRVVVIKRMLPYIAAEAGASDMFEAEARLGALVQHENVVQVFGLGTVDGQPYLTLEYVQGCDLWRLTRWLTREGQKLRTELSVHLVRQLLSGLDAVHRASANGREVGLVHRDVSPSNVLLSVYGEVKLGDFGIARARLQEHFPKQPLGERAKGKLGYLAPETVTGLEPDQHTDVFSAGVIMAELLMGRPLFAGGSELAVLLAIRDAKIGAFKEIMGGLPEGLGDAVVDALAKDRSDRVSSAAELRQRLAVYETTPSEALKRELGELVTRAMGFGAETSSQATPLHAGLPPGADGPAPTPLVSQQLETTPITTELPVVEYRVRTGNGADVQGRSFAQVIEMIATGRIGLEDQVSIGGGGFRKMSEITELRRHLPSSSLTPITREAPQPDDAHEQYDLEDGGFVRALAQSVVHRQTGLWLCEQGEIRKEVYVKNGTPEFVTSNLAGELLGEYLVRQQVISRAELDMALAVMPRFEGRLGDTFVALGLVEPVHLFRHIANQVRDKLIDLFLWKRGLAAFYPGVPAPPSGFPLGLRPWQILDEGIRQRFEAGLEDERFRARMTDGLVRAPFPPHLLESSGLPYPARQLIESLSTPRPLLDIIEEFEKPGDANRGYRLILLLLHLGAVRWEAR